MFIFGVFINFVRALRVAGIVSDFRIFIRVCVMRRSQWPRGLRSVCVRSIAGIACSNSDGIMALCLLRVLCVVRYKTLIRGDYLSRRVLPNVVCLSVIVKA